MAFNEVSSIFKSANILESEVGLVTKTRTGTQEMAETIDGRKVIKSGSLWQATHEEGGKTVVDEIGIVFEDYDMTVDEAYPIAVVFAGRIRADRVSSDVVALKSDFAAQGLYLIGEVGESGESL